MDRYERLDALKRTLRRLKKLEYRIRFNNHVPANDVYVVWDAYFTTKESQKKAVKYPLDRLVALGHKELTAIISDYFLDVYMQYEKETNPSYESYDPTLLQQLGLPANADNKDIKKQFRELAKQHHPDRGGDQAAFIKMMDIYNELISKIGPKPRI